MIQMQRSFSLPGHAHASPPLSPTIDQDSSRSPTPAPRRFSKSQWLVGPDTNYTTVSKSSRSFAERENSLNINQNSPVIPDELSNSDSAAVPRRKPLYPPLLRDISQYTDCQLKEAATEAASTTLEELAHLVRLSLYQERKRSQTRVRLQRSLVSTALSARLARCGELAHRTLVDNFRADDKKSFASLYNAIHDVRNSCDATRRYALLEPDLDLGQPKLDGLDNSGSYSTFMHEIPNGARDTILHFLTQIRTNPEFLATRISSLSGSEISALTLFHQGLEPIESVLPFYNRNRGHNSSSNRNSAYIPSAVERLLSFQRHDPLSTLIHTCFANSAGPDSTEDIRRTEVWATVCARLITESRSGADPFICSVLNIWTTMRDWSGRSNMEWYLMKILEDGAFLLEKAEDQAGTRIHVEPRNAKDSIAADEFYEASVKGLFELVDNPGAGGIPEGLLELGNAILRKLDPKRHNATRLFLVSKWLFSVFLVNATIHPESYGMMAEYHITEYGRQKILKEVAMRVQRLVVDLTWKQSAATPPEIRAHIESIMTRFRTARYSKSNPKLLPARSITSLRETVEVHPYLVISPPDLVTLVNALYPEKRPISSSLEKDIHLHGLRSSASSISGMSGISVPTAMPPLSRGFDTASIISTSGSSIFSDTTSREPLLDDGSSNNRFSSTSISSMSQTPRFEDDAHLLRMAIREMSHTLGTDVISGSCHPCAEQWAVLFMDFDGQQLSTQMIHDLDDDYDEDEDSSSSESSPDVPGSKPDLDKDYHQLRDSILKLVEDYEIPHSPHTKHGPKAFSNRTSIEGLRKKHRTRNKATPEGQESSSRNPYRAQDPKKHEKPSHERQLSNNENEDNKSLETTMEQPPVLLRMLEAAQNQCRAQSDFVNAHLYWRTSQQLQQVTSQSLKENGFVSLLNIFSRGPRDSIRRSASAIEEYDAWLVWLKQSQERHDVSTDAMMKRIKALRDKMWYVTDVRNSAAYEGARSVAVALKTMGTTKNSKHIPTSSTRLRSISKPSTNNFLLKTEAQILDILAAPEEHGGPNKLSDEQSDKTLTWLSQSGIENFCKGEERIHRFCLEVETCINKLVGDTLMEGPVLWSSELYQRDKRVLDDGRQKGDLIVAGLGTLSISGELGQETDSGRRSLRSVDRSSPLRSGPRDLRSMSARNNSQQSFDSSKWSMSRNSTADIMDSQDYFGTASPVMTIDSATTFWSPFHTRVQSPSTSIGSFRPGTASTTNETVLVTNPENAAIAAKQKFLGDLKQTLTSLLISDLGTVVFARGSETDFWFSGDLGQECMERKDRQDRRTRKKKLRVIEKKRSFRDLRSVQKKDAPAGDHYEAVEERREKGIAILERPINGSKSSDTQSIPDTSSSTSETLSTSSHKRQTSKDAQSLDFPYKVAFQRLLKMFSVHPNPYAKLNALYELERLIVASLTSVRRRKNLRPDTLPVSPQIPSFPGELGPHESSVTNMRAKNLDEAIDNVKERRSNTLVQADEDISTRKAADNRSIKASNAASTDMIVEVLQDLFREADMRPKTLFRDLQFIAAFVPSSVLDKTDKGKAFWDTGLAALGLKQDVCRTLIEIADEIVLYYTQTRQASTICPPELKDGTRGLVMQYSMQDAARMWTITAKEGDPVAERELAIFYLTHPELMERTTLPLTKPKETFKAQVMEMHGGGVGGGKEGDRERSDPATMCVAYHWMELSALGGDELAKKYLRQREELNALP